MSGTAAPAVAGRPGMRATVVAVMAGHFLAAFSALGMPPFFGVILERSFACDAPHLAGWLYILPTACTALSSPWWGRIADRIGTKPLLVRAQIGLSISFLIAGFASDVLAFAVALALQGVLGGTFSASNAYLGTILSGHRLARGLTLMQWSARAALVAAPLCFGAMITLDSPVHLYRYLALLPLVGAAIVLALPAHGQARHAPIAREPGAPADPAEADAMQIYCLQFAFVFATVMTFPYFVAFVSGSFPGLPGWSIGLLFGLPHLVYLLLAAPAAHLLGRGHRLATLAGSFIALSLCCAGQAYVTALWALVAWRLGMGVAMTIAFIALHALMAGVVRARTAGRTFGWFESGAKWGAVAGGLTAGSIVGTTAPWMPFLLASGVLAAAASLIAAARRAGTPVGGMTGG